MKTNLFSMFRNGMAVLLSAGLLFSCSQVETFETQDLSLAQAKIPVNFKSTDPNTRVGAGYDACGTPLTAKLLAGQTIPVGEVTVFNDDEKFYVTVSIEKGDGFDNGDWFIQKIHGYFGSVEVDFLADPKGKQKKGIINPAPGKFPISESISLDYSVADQEFTYELAIDDYLKDMGEFDVAIHAEVVRVENIRDEDGVTVADIVQSESAWGEGQRFNQGTQGNWSMYMSYAIQECEVNCDANWSRSFEMFGQRNADLTEPVIQAEYFINNAASGVVGTVIVTREGEFQGNNKQYTFTADFIPADGYSFHEVLLCVAPDADSSKFCDDGGGSDLIMKVQGTDSIAKFKGDSNSTTTSWVTVSLKSSACDTED